MKKTYLLTLLIIPVLLIITAAAMKYARGPYYICSDTEQDYIYLISSLALAESKPVLYTDHPGTTLQILGAVTLKITHALDFDEKDSLEFAVLKNPEFYLTAINIVLVSLNALLLFIIGLVTFNLTKSIGLGLLLQFSPFFSNIPLRWGLNQVSCEPLLLFVSLLLMLVLVKMVLSENLTKTTRWYMISLALVSGFGIATKVTFIPLLIIPLFALPKLRYKIGFLLLTGLSAVLWTWPIRSQYERILQRLYLILTHTGWYGVGPASLINPASLQDNLLNILWGLFDDPLFLLLFFFVPCIILTIYWSSKKRGMAWQDTSFRLLVAIITVQLCTVLIVVKQSAERYALPVLCISGFLLFLIFIYLQKNNYLRRFDAKKVTFFMVIIFILFGAWRAFEFTKTFNELLLIKNDSLAYYPNAEKEYKYYLKIFVNLQPRSIAPFTLAGLSYGNNMASRQYLHIKEISEGMFSKGLYSDTLQKIYGDAYFYNLCSGEFYTWTKSFFIEDMIIKRKITKIAFYFPPNFIEKQDISLPCMTGTVLHLRDISEGVYDNIYILKGISKKAVNFEQVRSHCY